MLACKTSFWSIKYFQSIVYFLVLTAYRSHGSIVQSAAYREPTFLDRFDPSIVSTIHLQNREVDKLRMAHN